MKSILLLIVGAIVGAVAMLVFATPYFTGVGAGAGIVTGWKAGACMTVEAAKDGGFITAEQVDEIFRAAAKQFADTDIDDEAPLTGANAECAKVLADLKSAARN